MSISAIMLENFKRFGPLTESLEAWHPLRPITVLLGPNSSGKSSILHALLMLAQTCRRGVSGVLELQPTGTLVDLGTFSNALHRTSISDDSRGIRIGLEIGGHRIIAEWDSDWRPGAPYASPVAPLTSLVIERLAYHSDNDETSVDGGRRRLVLVPASEEGSLRTQRDDERDTSSQRYGPSMNPWAFLGSVAPSATSYVELHFDDQAGISGSAHDFASGVERPVPLESQRDFAGVLASYVASRVSEMRDDLRSMSHLGPLRHRGHRIYQTQRANSRWRVGRDGERMVDVLLAPMADGVQVTVNEYLRDLDLGFALELRPTGITADAYELILCDARGRELGDPVRVGLPDVGSGVGQVVPLLVQIARAQVSRMSRPALVLSEQPELHLHPRGQAKLARILCKAARADVGRTPVNLLLETHSEHLIYALGNEIAHKRYDHSQAICLNFEPSPDGGQPWVKAVEFLPDGEFASDFPREFFPERDQLARERYG